MIPQHIAIIMDGNRRWARERSLPVIAGHRKVANDILEPLIEHAAKRGISYITFWAWSTENWQRDRDEVSGIMKLFRYVIHKRWARLHEKGVRVRTIGDISQFDDSIRKSLEKVVEQTKSNKKITATFALNYGGRDEIVRAVNKYILNCYPERSRGIPTELVQYRGILRSAQNDKLTEEIFSSFLDTAGMPDPELIIRTGGEQRLSGFLLWQSEYSEFYFAPWYMPEFTGEKLDEVLEEFQHRKRRFGR